MVAPIALTGVLLSLIFGGGMSWMYFGDNAPQNLELNVYLDYAVVTNEDFFPTFYQVLHVAPEAGDMEIISALETEMRKLGEDGSVPLGDNHQGVGLEASDLELSHVLVEMVGVLLDKKHRRVYDKVFAPALTKRSFFGGSQNRVKLDKVCSKVAV
ncbi:hypothetical protein QBC47DRAFT_440153 [Echria macrotheca]|uniref:Uncharacterized protein n=1 Tax=Echria macrotheca TaxID=438768 RepID=A0AAJ0B0W4_9PEZI|nr:hypothetical protein QBC47DRAFT_440153 [Echria macrotheca]